MSPYKKDSVIAGSDVGFEKYVFCLPWYVFPLWTSKHCELQHVKLLESSDGRPADARTTIKLPFSQGVQNAYPRFPSNPLVMGVLCRVVPRLVSSSFCVCCRG